MPFETTTMANVSLESIDESESVSSSPSDMSYPKSSKSSFSLTSDDELSDVPWSDKSVTHGEDFIVEDIERDRDSGEDCNLPPDSRPTLKRPAPRSVTVGDLSSTRQRLGTSPPWASLPDGRRPSRPILHRPVKGLPDQSLHLPPGRQSTQRAVSSPTVPGWQHLPPDPSSRSPSRRKHMWPQSYRSIAPEAVVSTIAEPPFHLPRNLATRSPRNSWQPGRKTVAELEAEYNDEDEEVPEEAILENVPISPMPGQYSAFQSTSTSPNALRSTTPSPQRKPFYANLHSANIPKQAKRRSANGLPRSPHGRPPTLPQRAILSALPAEPFGRKQRSKSWTEDLNEEARQLTHALEEYSAQMSTSASGPLRSSPPSLPEASSKTPTNHMPLPSPPKVPLSLQIGSVIIDPLPISKEKEAVLTRTRPSWLPPKSQREERKHLREFQQIMARAAEAEKKRALKERETRESLVEQQDSMARVWEQHVLPHWDAVMQESRTRELWWRGVPPKNRGEVWQRAVKNELELTGTSYEAALARAHALEQTLAKMSKEERAKSKEAAWMDAIARDVPHTFPGMKIYQRDAPLHETLSSVLKAYAMYRSDVGYVYGTHLIAGIICSHLSAPDAFVLLANLQNRPLSLAFLVHDRVAMTHAYTLTMHTLKYKLPALHAHLTNPALALQPHEFLDPLFRCLFAYNLPRQHISRIWDVFVFEGDKTLIRAAVALLTRFEHRLYGTREEVLNVCGWKCEAPWTEDVIGGEEEFMCAVMEAGKVHGSEGSTTTGRSRSA